MSATRIDEIDIKILKALMRNLREKQKDIAKDCDISTTAVANRIEKLKKNGVIKGATFIPNFSKMGYTVAGVLIAKILNGNHLKIVQAIKEYASTKNNLILTFCNYGMGNYDLLVAVLMKNTKALDEIVRFVGGLQDVGKVVTHLFLGEGEIMLENLVIEPIGS